MVQRIKSNMHISQQRLEEIRNIQEELKEEIISENMNGIEYKLDSETGVSDG